MYATGFFTAGLIVGMSFGVIVGLALVGSLYLSFKSKYRDKSEEAERLRSLSRAAIAAHRTHHEQRLRAI